MNKKFDWNLLSRYRGELYGLSIASIMIFHYFEDTSIYGAPHSLILKLSYPYMHYISSLGVDIFLILSGLSLYYSMKKDPHIFHFYQKRLSRVIIPYLITGTPFWIIRYFLRGSGTLIQFLKDLSTISFWESGNRQVWYISFIIILYLIYPLVFQFLQKFNFPVFCCTIMLTAFSILCCKTTFPAFYSNCEIALWRIIPFEIGVYLGVKSYNKETIPIIAVPVFAIAGLFLRRAFLFHGFIFIDGRFLSTLYAFSLLLLGVCICSLFPNQIFHRILIWLGNNSLELYLTHVLIRGLCLTASIPTNNPAVYCLVLAISIFISPWIHTVASQISSRIVTRS